MTKLYKYGLGIGAALVTAAGAIGISSAATTTPVTVPSDLAASMLSQVGIQLQDPGTETVIIVVAALFVTFWVIHAVLGLVPKSRGGRRA